MDKMPRVLVVDDDPRVRSFLLRILRPLAATIIEADNGIDALLKVNDLEEYSEQFALILSDTMMPAMDGTELFRQMKKRGFDMKRFWLMSGGMSPDKKRFVKEQGITLIEKPIDSNELLELVRQILAS